MMATYSLRWKCAGCRLRAAHGNLFRTHIVGLPQVFGRINVGSRVQPNSRALSMGNTRAVAILLLHYPDPARARTSLARLSMDVPTWQKLVERRASPPGCHTHWTGETPVLH